VKKLELEEVIAMEIEVVEVFHFEEEFAVDRPSKTALSVKRSNDSSLEGGGSTGPVGGHLAIIIEARVKTEKIR
jgi:hypothetical protein